MLRDHIKLLYAYHSWANERVLRTTQRIDLTQANERTRRGYARIHETLVHLVDAEAIWRSRWQRVSLTDRLTRDDLPTLHNVQRRWQDEQRQIQRFIDSLRDDDLAAALSYTNLRGQSVTVPLGATLLHVCNHGTQHRSEVAFVLTEMGHSPGDLDLLLYLLEQQGPSPR